MKRRTMSQVSGVGAGSVSAEIVQHPDLALARRQVARAGDLLEAQRLQIVWPFARRIGRACNKCESPVGPAPFQIDGMAVVGFDAQRQLRQLVELPFSERGRITSVAFDAQPVAAADHKAIGRDRS